MRAVGWPRHYILVDRMPVAVDLLAWARFFEDMSNRRVAEDRFGKVYVSTAFLGIDHNFRGGEPLLFETMVFGGPLDGETWRYASWAEAERGHADAVTQSRIAAAQIKAIANKAGAE